MSTRQQLIIFSTQRSGSTMVCDDIAGTNLLGRPSEYLIKLIKSIGKINQNELNISIDMALDKGRTDNGITAIKVMSNQIRPMGRVLQEAGICSSEDKEECFYNYFKDSIFCQVIRKDKVAQAVSRIMARQTNMYHSVEHTKGLEGMIGRSIRQKNRDEGISEYNKKDIYLEIQKIKNQEALIKNFIDRFNIECKPLIYEDVIKDRSYVKHLAAEFNYKSVFLVDRRLKKISGSISQEWIDRYKLEF